jgi:glycosyltransferase 2 family protein
MSLRTVVHSRTVLVVCVAVTVAVPALTMRHLPSVSVWPLLLGLLPWVIGKYVLCPLRWRVLTAAGPRGRLSSGWHLRAHAEGELLGLLTPGHVGADVWRVRRLAHTGLGRTEALMSVGTDRIVGAIGLTAFVAFASTALPTTMLLVAAGVGVVLVVAALGIRLFRPHLIPRQPLPRPRALFLALVLSLGYQLTIAGMLLGTVAATGHELSPLALLGAFGASQVAAAVPGPNGASPRDGALVVALVALGLPWAAAAAAVSLKAVLAWLPALALGGLSLLLWRRQGRAVPVAA